MNDQWEFQYRYDDWPLIPCRIANPLTGEWIEIQLFVDTGADATVLDEELARYLGVEITPEPVNVRGFGGLASGQMGMVDITPMGLDTLRVRLEPVFIAGIAGGLGNILGLDYFANADIFLSHANNLVALRLPA